MATTPAAPTAEVATPAPAAPNGAVAAAVEVPTAPTTPTAAAPKTVVAGSEVIEGGEVKPLSEAAERGLYLIPKVKHVELKTLDNKAAEIQKRIGAMTVDFELNKTRMITEYLELQKKYDETLNGVTTEAGIDVRSGREMWKLDMDKGVFERTGFREVASEGGKPN